MDFHFKKWNCDEPTVRISPKDYFLTVTIFSLLIRDINSGCSLLRIAKQFVAHPLTPSCDWTL